MNGKPYVVTIEGTICVDTTVAVIAESEEEAERTALARCSLRNGGVAARRLFMR